MWDSEPSSEGFWCGDSKLASEGFWYVGYWTEK